MENTDTVSPEDYSEEDYEFWSQAISEFDKNERINDWQHKQILDTLPDFQSKLCYWSDEVCKDSWTDGKRHREDLQFTLTLDFETLASIADKFGICREFTINLEVYIKTDEEREKFEEFMEYHIKRRLPFLNDTGMTWNELTAAKYTASLENLKIDLEARLTSFAQKLDVLELELKLTTETIDAAIESEKGVTAQLSAYIQNLRMCLKVNGHQDFTLSDELYPGIAAVRLAQIRDIIFYEAHLRNLMLNLTESTTISKTKVEAVKEFKTALGFTQTTTQEPDKTNLTVREKALVHVYKSGSPIKRGNPLYNDYIAFATFRKRIAYPNDSPKKAKSLVASIEKILPYLTLQEIQLAQNEIDIIVASFS